MIKTIILTLFLICASVQPSFAAQDRWYYGIGTLLDRVTTTKVEFIMADGKVLIPNVTGGGDQTISKKLLSFPDSYFFGSSLGQVMYTPYPAKIYFEWVSYVARKRYAVTVDVPSNLPYINKRIFALGVVANGYYEFYFSSSKKGEDVFISRGIAREVVTAYDKSVPLDNQYKNRLASFDKYYAHLIKQYPIPYWRFSLDQPPIISTYPNNVWGNRQPTQEWLDYMEAEKQANAPPPPPKNRCWPSKPAELDKKVTLTRGTNEHQMQRLLWNQSVNLISGVSLAGNDENAAIIQAWQEAKQKGLDDDHAQVWVLARFVSLVDYPINTLTKEIPMSKQGEETLKQYVTEMCASVQKTNLKE